MNKNKDLLQLKTNMSRVIIEHNYLIVGDIEDLLMEASTQETIQPEKVSNIVERLQVIREMNMTLYEGVISKF